MAAETSLADRASELETTWQQEGHPSLAQAQCALACAEKSTLPSVRVLAYAKLKGRAEPASTLASNSLPKRPTGGGSTRGGIGFVGGASFLIVAHAAVRALEAIARVFRHPLHVTARLPHINLPVGDEKDAEISMEAMIDTGAGLNLGRRQYHAEVFRLRPEIVEQYEEIDNVSNMEKFGIGGIKGSDIGIQCTAVITYKLPYVHNGAPVRLTIALSDDAAANTILSSGLLKNTKCAILFGQDVLVSDVLGEHFPIHYTTPSCNDSPPEIGAGMPSTFFAEQLTDDLHQQVAAMIAEADTEHGLQNPSNGSNFLGLSTRATHLANTTTSSQVKLSPCIRVDASSNRN